MTEEAKLQEFEARVNRGDKVEPGDWMPEDYRKNLIRMISQHAHSEIVGALPEGTWIPYAPNFKRKMALIAKVQDEVGHGQMLYKAAETLGVSREEMINDLLMGRATYSNVFNYPAETWADVAIIGWLIDGAAIVNQTKLLLGSYGPYARAMERICYEEGFHLKQGYDAICEMMAGTKNQRDLVQDALNRWWWPIMMFFGPRDKDSVHSAQLMRWKVKIKSNDELRQEFLGKFVPKIRAFGLVIPDPELRYDEEKGEWLFTEPDWDEFKRVIRGNGPMNKERIAVRRLAHDEGRWVREALERFVEEGKMA
ncbi:MAG: 1,2-phenylacetyl-CoA epoxidase subunit A [Ectothiorhodospiraceae bacterium]|nr:1,2-phenylacetyl-CoA epoxidase subunit A [Ectothiorhodospiraceae bacterium]